MSSISTPHCSEYFDKTENIQQPSSASIRRRWWSGQIPSLPLKANTSTGQQVYKI